MTPTDDSTSTVPDPETTYVQRLLHRWLVEYNPFYLLSAALVLIGTSLCSSGLAREDGLVGPLGVAGIAELYAACLIGGAALLTRIGQRRPAVILALLALLYQWDLTLHTERSPYLGSWAAAAWVLLFVGKLYGLAWALKLRLSPTAAGAWILAGVGLVFFPAHLHRLAPETSGSLLAAWVFAIASLQRRSVVESLVPLEGWPATVLHRSVRAAWILSAVLVSGHVLFWSSQHTILLSVVLPVVPLLALRGVRSELRVWAIAIGTLIVVAVAMPFAFSVTALLAAVALVLRAISPAPITQYEKAPPVAPENSPYRTHDAPKKAPAVRATVVPIEVTDRVRNRLLAGAVFGIYLSAWTHGWSCGPWPAHALALDLVLTAVIVFAAWKLRVRSAIAPLVATYLHLGVQVGLLAAPRSLEAWGVSSVSLGFLLLLGSLGASYRLRAVPR